jgi:hypothetical protein
MSAVRFAAVVLGLLALALAPAANAAPSAPTGLKPFLLRADEAPAVRAKIGVTVNGMPAVS